MLESLRTLLERDLETLKAEILAYPDEQALWTVAPGIANSAGTLTLHLCGNLQHYIGALLGGTGYARDRPAEFASRDVPREQLLRLVDQTTRAVGQTLSGLDEGRLGERFPEELRGMTPTVELALIHIYGHFSYHLGQVNYHRRLLS